MNMGLFYASKLSIIIRYHSFLHNIGRSNMKKYLLFGMVLARIASSQLAHAQWTDGQHLAGMILETNRTSAERESFINGHPWEADVLVSVMTTNLPNDSVEESARIPWIWRVAIAAGKRNNAIELKSLLNVALPKANEPLRDWQAVVIGGGIINGLSLQGIWPDDRVAELLLGDKDLQTRWDRTLDLASAMAENVQVKSGTRYDALRIIGVDTWERRGAQLEKYLAKDANAELQQGAVSGLADMKSKNVGPTLVKNLQNLSDRNRAFALDALLRDDSRVAVLLDAVDQKKVSRSTLGVERIGKLEAVSNKKLRARAQKDFARTFPVNGGSTYHVGIAKVDITPNYPIRLNGYLARKAESTGVLHPLYAKALAIGADKEGPAILISVDNCIVPKKVRDELAGRLAKKGIASEKFAMLVSHTHTAPKLAGAADNIYGSDIPAEDQAHIDRYTREFVDALEKVAITALKNRAPAKLAWGQTKAGFGGNRRTKGGPVDHDVPVLLVTQPNGTLRGILVSYACHCTTLDGTETRICPDWAGYTQQYLEDVYPGVVAMTGIGCGADQNPFPRPGVDMAKQHGSELASAVDELLLKDLTPLNGKLECRSKQIALPFDTLPTREEYQKRAEDQDKSHYPIIYHAKKQLARLDRGEKLMTELPYLVQEWNFGNDLAMAFLPGEVVVDYSLRLKKEFDASHLWVNGYANYVPCYIPSKRIWSEGGYEGGGAMVYYDLPTRLSEKTEDLIVSAVHDIVPKQFVSNEQVSEFPAPLSPQEALKSFRTKPGFTVDLAASEPQIVDPVAIDFGTDGKLWVVEMHDYPMGVKGDYAPGGRVKLLTSSKHDGHYDKSTTFIENIPFPTGIMQWRKGVLICTAPDILYAEDTDGDGKADVVKKLFTGFATHNFQARVNGLRWGLDNWVYAAAGLFGGTIRSELAGKIYELSGRDFRFNPDTGDFEPVSGLSQQSRVRDDWGNWFGCDNSNLAWNWPLEERYIRRNPFVAAPEPRVTVPQYPDPNVLFPVSQTLERFNHPESANRTTSACGIGLYTDILLGQDYYGNSFTCEPVHNLVRRLVLKTDGIAFSGSKPDDEQQTEFFASTDSWSRPVEVRTGPDGALWISDMYRFVIEHPKWIPAERLAKLDVRAGDDKGRVYRVYPTAGKLRPIHDLTSLSTAKLVALLDSPNGTERDLIHRELYQRADKSAIKPLEQLASKSSNPAVRVQALCALEGLKGLQLETLQQALADKDSNVRRQAMRLSENFLRGTSASALGESLLKLASDSDPGVRFQLALTLGEWDDIRAGQALGNLARSSLSNHWMRAAVLSSAVNQPGEILKGVLALPADTANRGEMVGQLIATASGAKNPKTFESILVAIAPVNGENIPQWQLVALGNLQEALGRQKLSLNSFAESSDASIREAAKRIQSGIASAGAIAANSKAPVADREASVRLLAWSNDERDLKSLVSLATQTTNTRLQKAANKSLHVQRNPKVPEMLLAGWPQYSPSVREHVLDILLSRDEGIDQLFSAVEQKTIAPTEIPIANRQQLQKSSNPKIQQRAAALLPLHTSDRTQVLKKFSDVAHLAGNPEHGAQIFTETCATCHHLKGVGNSVGPDLAALNDKSIEDFLVAILDPNAAIEPRFIQYNIEVKDGRSLSGVIQNETATSLTLVQPGGIHETILRSEISEMRASSLSLMPEGLEEGKKPQDFADLIAYLKSQPSQFGSASPEKAAAARKSFLADGYDLARVVSASEAMPYPGWLGTLMLSHCRQTDGNSKVEWETKPVDDLNPHGMNTFRVPVAMGLLSNPSGKFYLKVNGRSGVDFDVSINDAVWKNPASEVILQYHVMENNPEDSNGVLTISVRGEWLKSGKPIVFEVTGSASNSQRWFGIYTMEPQSQASRN
ncbi:membrane-bound dehydrogenase domain protein [Pedosphaera parvula Ellin514]|uniref:Membrane-bound dehydrogenase domain protein n=2 Tax=Pedosphaera TaxID=1032526 RepID=B9XF61_PEDPL|nr:membrane-bound dehydrogenase domain protein [Pedosphaera parvula Ellin514]